MMTILMEMMMVMIMPLKYKTAKKNYVAKRLVKTCMATYVRFQIMAGMKSFTTSSFRTSVNR